MPPSRAGPAQTEIISLWGGIAMGSVFRVVNVVFALEPDYLGAMPKTKHTMRHPALDGGLTPKQSKFFRLYFRASQRKRGLPPRL
jgi:hypothetical protein